VRVDFGNESQVPLDQHLEILASAEFQVAAARFDARPHFVGE
jgi:hypothetical protein